MKKLYIKAERKTPLVDFDPFAGVFRLKGRSIPENTYDFYTVVMHWLDEYLKMPAEKSVLNFELDYFNTSSSKFLLEMFKKLKTLERTDREFLVRWHFETGDEEMMETGRDFMELLNLNFEFIEFK